MSSLEFLLPGNPDTPTGGYIYARRVRAGLRDLGWDVRVHGLSEHFPRPDAAALAHADSVLCGLPAGALTAIDGLALGAMPEVAARHAERLRLVGLVHHPLAEETMLPRQRVRALFESEKAALAAVGTVIVTNPFTAKALARYEVAQSRIRVVRPGVEPAPLAVGSGGNGPTMLCVGSYIARKGHDVLLAALSMLTDLPWRLECVGEAALEPDVFAAVRRDVEGKGLSNRVTLLRAVSPEALSARYQAADLFVLASRYEGHGMVIDEAVAHGLPIVATAGGAIPYTVPKSAAVLAPVGDAAALADALRRVVASPRLRRRLAAGSRRARAALPSWADAARDFARALQPGPPA